MAHDHAPNYADDPNICLTCEQEREAERAKAELAKEAGIPHMTPEQQDAWWNGK